MTRLSTCAALLGLLACSATVPSTGPQPPAVPVPVPATPEPTAFPPFETIRVAVPVVANLSATACLVAWPAEITEYRATFLFRTDDGGASFRSVGESGGIAAEAWVSEGRVWLLQHYSGGGILPVIDYSDDGGLTWIEKGAAEQAVAGGTSMMNELDRLSFRDRLTGKVRWNGDRWLETTDGGDSWHVVSAEPSWTAPPPVDGPCRADGKTLQRRTAAGGWEPVPGAPGT